MQIPHHQAATTTGSQHHTWFPCCEMPVLCKHVTTTCKMCVAKIWRQKIPKKNTNIFWLRISWITNWSNVLFPLHSKSLISKIANTHAHTHPHIYTYTYILCINSMPSWTPYFPYGVCVCVCLCVPTEWKRVKRASSLSTVDSFAVRLCAARGRGLSGGQEVIVGGDVAVLR